MVNTGKEYELFVTQIQQALIDSDGSAKSKNIVVETDKKIVDNCGIERQFDVYWEYELGGYTYKTVIECKDYNSKVSVDKIDALIGKLQDLPGIKPIFATKIGYQSGAEAKALKHNIELLVVREQNESDWVDDDGAPLIKKLQFNIRVCPPAKISKFDPLIDAYWIKNNTDLKLEQIESQYSGLNTEIIIEDVSQQQQYSLYDLEYILQSSFSGNYNTKIIEDKTFEDAFIHYSGLKLRLTGYHIEYMVPQPFYAPPIAIDRSKGLIGVIEHLKKGVKRKVFEPNYS